MAQVVQRQPPLPAVQSFLTCREVLTDQRTGQVVLIGPTAHVPVVEFPAPVRMSIFAEFAGGHGSYQPRLALLNAAGETVWGWSAPAPFEHGDPLRPTSVTFHDLLVAVPHPGRYNLMLSLNGQEAASRAMWFGPAAAFRT